MTLFKRLWWLIPLALLLFTYWQGLTAWFLMDDFAWLSLRRHVYTVADLPRTFFLPMAQGTIRTFSERLYFIGLFELFGMRALPFRIVAFVTAGAASIMIAMLTRRMTGSLAAGVLAACFWVVNDGMPTPMYWTSAFNQLLISFTLALSAYNFVRFCETGERRYLIYQWVSFVLGFGVLEINVVYPAIALAYALAKAPKRIVSALWMFPVSVAYAVVHRANSADRAPEIYRLYFDLDLPRTFGRYWKWLMAADRAANFVQIPKWLTTGATVLFTVAIVGFVVQRARRKDWIPTFGLAWFLIVMAPLVPIKLHPSDYYLVSPSIGIAVLAGYGVVSAWQSRVWRFPALALAIGFFAFSIMPMKWATNYHVARTHRVRDLVQSITYAVRQHPKDIILLDKVSADLFYDGVRDHPWYCLGITSVYLTPESHAVILKDPGLDRREMRGYQQPEAIVYRGLGDGVIQVYDVTTRPIRNVTSEYRGRVLARPEPEAPETVFVGQRLYREYLDGEWFEPEETHRWMGQRASLRIRGPQRADQKLTVEATVPDFLVAKGPAKLRVFVNDELAGTSELREMAWEFRERYAIPLSALQSKVMEVRLELDRTGQAAEDPRKLGIAVTRVSTVEE